MLSQVQKTTKQYGIAQSVSYLLILCKFYLVIFLTFTLQADLRKIHDVYGLYDAVEDKYKHLSPFHGFLLFERYIPNVFYLYVKEDDPIAILVRNLFFKVPGELELQTTKKPAAVEAYLNAETIGKLIAAIELDSRNVPEETQAVVIKHTKDNLSKQFVKILTETIKKDLKKKVKSEAKSNTLIQEFSDRILNALEVSGHFGSTNQLYPKYVTDFILLSFLYSKITKKDDLKQYFAQFQNANFNEKNGILKADAKIWNQAYKLGQEEEILKQLESQEADNLWNYAIENYESLGFALIMLQKFHKAITYKQSVTLDWFKNLPQIQKLEQYAISDCMENALRNLLNLVFYDEKTKEFVLPTAIDGNSSGAQFYKEFNALEMHSADAHDKWASIVSDIPNVTYLKRVKIENNKIIKETSTEGYVRPEKSDIWYYYELKPNLADIHKIIKHIFNLNLKGLDDFFDYFKLKCHFTVREESEVICQITNLDQKKCKLSITTKHAVASMEETKEFQIAFTKVSEKLGEVVGNLAFEIKPEFNSFNLTQMMNLYALPFDYEIITYNLDFLVKSGYLRYNFITSMKIKDFTSNLLEFTSLADSITKELIASNLKEKPREMRWYEAFFSKFVAL